MERYSEDDQRPVIDTTMSYITERDVDVPGDSHDGETSVEGVEGVDFSDPDAPETDQVDLSEFARDDLSEFDPSNHIEYVRRELLFGASGTDLAEQFDVAPAEISRIANGRRGDDSDSDIPPVSWDDSAQRYVVERSERRHDAAPSPDPTEHVEYLRKQLLSGATAAEMSDRFDTDRSYISRIVRGKKGHEYDCDIPPVSWDNSERKYVVEPETQDAETDDAEQESAVSESRLGASLRAAASEIDAVAAATDGDVGVTVDLDTQTAEISVSIDLDSDGGES